MCSQSDFTSAIARAIKLATPPEQLVPAADSRGDEEEAAREHIDRIKDRGHDLKLWATQVCG
jgi:hypothetical protein